MTVKDVKLLIKNHRAKAIQMCASDFHDLAHDYEPPDEEGNCTTISGLSRILGIELIINNKLEHGKFRIKIY